MADNPMRHDVGSQPVWIWAYHYYVHPLNVHSFVSFDRPAWSTGILIPASFLCGIVAAVFIWHGGQKTKRTKEVAERLRLALAMDEDPTQMYQGPHNGNERAVHQPQLRDSRLT
jgi:hypothetical protein